MRNEARQYFTDSGLSFDDIRREHIDTLREIIQTHLDRRNEKLSDTKMTVNKRMRKPDFAGGKLKQCEITMRCHYFNSREAITFDRSGFIGFAGWADDGNVNPLTDAFKEWVDWLRRDTPSEG
jgi:hypothetical protein